MTDAGPPPMPPYSPAPPVRRSRTNLVVMASAAAVIAAVAVTGTVVAHSGHGSEPAAPAAPTGGATETPASTPSYGEVTADSFTVELRTTKRQCFGTAGCNVTVEPDLTYLGDSADIDPDAVYEITYEIHGDESGPVIETAELSDRTRLNYPPSMISTASAGTNVSVEITDVTARGG
ncbi:hypothetical protein [Streptomyces fuscichromogenes]|uniref:Uncharacterized protein n=1 Tax=Streptomyces fuscichromogenes TaxID=1324013 RepID=A0A917XE86_9ACTN|nr:hypothetical protein [Streptomyces fuscichromogenes]GGN15514.1 hypothetical protein GCM10011578_043600 [Streptomyces fuscichromogenes]